MSTKYPQYTMTAAGNRAKAWAEVGAPNVVDACLAECVNPAYDSAYNIPGPWGFGGNGKPWAINFWLHAVAHGKVVKTSDPADVPFGALGFMIDVADIGKAKPAGAGHVFEGDGESGAYSTDRPKNGHWGHVSIASIEKAWNKKLVGYILVTGDGYTLTDKARPVVDWQPHDAYWTVDVAKGSTLNGRDYPSTALGKVLVSRARGIRLHTTEISADGAWVRTRFGTCYAVEHLAKAAAPGKPTPPPEPKYVDVKVVYQNVALYNADDQPGVTGYKTHIPNIAKAVRKAKPDLAAFVELGNRAIAKGLPLMDAGLKGVLTRAPKGTDGRDVYTNDTTVKVVASGNLIAAKSTWYAKDDKQAAWVVYEKDGIRGSLMTYQLAFQDGAVADGDRVAQSKDFLKQYKTKVLAKYKVQARNAIIVGDTNSEGRVAKAMIAAGWPPVSYTSKTPTFNGWGKGPRIRIDWIFRLAGVHVTGYTVTKSTDSDHDRLTFTHRLEA